MDVVNGYPCKNCTDVELAKKGVDPARPKDGPNGVYRTAREDEATKADASRSVQDSKPSDYGPAVKLDGALAGVAQADKAREQPPAYGPGMVTDLRA